MFITIGRKSHCNHEHETYEEAQKCVGKHISTLRAQNKISDRVIVEVDSLEEADEMLESNYY